ncbi:hypothetical protein NDU88_003678 [Pleurodeles waltl]|uniref:Uncharacterized protein n=1 Tax=Pleurodeles waltl TaxID=8319 RepID=A0AAV7T5C7_PLEWA|nr:hypothetical protein NDU88_003678 [Pleurodeles waltl]
MSRKRRSRIRPQRVGDRVLVWNRRTGGRFKLPFELVPWTVMRTRSTMITVMSRGESVTRNVSFFKRYRSEGVETRAGAGELHDDSDCVENSDDPQLFPELAEKNCLGNVQDGDPQLSGGTSVALERDSMERLLVGSDPAGTVESVPLRASSGRFHLRPPPPLSSTLRDFVLM